MFLKTRNLAVSVRFIPDEYRNSDYEYVHWK